MDPGFNFVDDRIIFGAWKQQPTAALIKEFLVLLGVCHSVQIENETVDGVVCSRFAASSPDEAALVFGAANLGCRFVKRDGKITTVNMDGSLEHYEVMADNEFNSTRKRQSLLVKRPNGSLILFCKGADTVIYDRLAATSNDTCVIYSPSVCQLLLYVISLVCRYNSVTTKHLVEFSEQGLRTLCLAFREISAEEVSSPPPRLRSILDATPCNGVVQAKSWMAVYTEASVALVGREEKLMGVAELIEKDLTLIGATAIEDKLQVGVSETISHLAQANIKLWVLTGDKKETAINIGFACAVLTQQMSILEIDVHSHEEAAAQLQVARVGLNDTKSSGKPVALVVTGAALVFMLEPALIMDFLAVSCECVSVICCRVSPLQKRLVTKMVKDNKKVITLSIGDGANDVPMIQAAHIGVGIRGLEGQQAAAASDYAIAQFR
jgi:phospholipid-transporting ATPase